MIYSPHTTFYFCRDQEQVGPVSLEEMQSLIAAGELKPEHLCWTDGLPAWDTVANLIPIVAALPAPTLPVHLEPMLEAAQSSKQRSPKYADAPNHITAHGYYGGLGRLSYFLITTGLTMMQWAMEQQNSMSMSLIFIVIFIGGIVYSTLLRLKNLGLSKWWLLSGFVPGLNLVGCYRLTVCPEGWGNSRTLDKTGKILIWVWVVIILLAIAGIFLPEVENT